MPNSYRGVPDRVSIPMLASRKPTIVDTVPLMGSSPSSQPMDIRDMIIREVISAGPNSRPTSARAGPRKVRISIPTRPPMQEARFEVNRAWPGWPFSAMGWPSSTVITAGESPGTFSRMAEKAPPYMLE